LTNTVAEEYEPAWSPDGTKIAFTSTRDGNYEIYSMNADGDDPQRMTNNLGLDGLAAWQTVFSTQNNPIDDAGFFVRQHYTDFLNRVPDAAGLAFWTDQINNCGTDTLCVDSRRVNTSGAYFLSTEFQSTGYFVYRLYLGGINRQPLYSEFQADQKIVAEGIVVDGKLSDKVIEDNKNKYAKRFIDATGLNGLSNQGFVDRLFANTKVAVSASDRAALVTELNNDPQQRPAVLRKVLDGTTTVNDGELRFTTTYGQAFYEQQINPAFVLMQYFGYLRRDPDADGYKFWFDKLNKAGNFTDAQMVRSFIVSEEYRARFGPAK
jgi:hypothetical protein